MTEYAHKRLTAFFAQARDDGVAVASAEPYANHLHLAPDRQPCQHLITRFYGPDALPVAKPTESKHDKQVSQIFLAGEATISDPRVFCLI